MGEYIAYLGNVPLWCSVLGVYTALRDLLPASCGCEQSDCEQGDKAGQRVVGIFQVKMMRYRTYISYIHRQQAGIGHVRPIQPKCRTSVGHDIERRFYRMLVTVIIWPTSRCRAR